VRAGVRQDGVISAARVLSAEIRTVSHTFSEAGRLAYHCEPHPVMKGTVVVE
jgi:plastocyanin